MSFTESESPQISSHDADEWGQYRSLSTLAVVAFILGLCSLLVFASPLMLVVPLAAIAAALLALRGIAAAEGGLSGAGLARCGLALAILFSVAAVARVKTRDALLRQQVDTVARQWMMLATQNRPKAMLKMMTKAAGDKLTPAVATGSPMPFFGEVLATALLRQDPLVLKLADLPEVDSTRLKLQEADVALQVKPPQGFARYTAVDADPPWSCSLVLNRYETSTGGALWLVDSWKIE